MSLPLFTKPEDIKSIVNYLITKPTGATLNEIKAVLGSKIIDPRKISSFCSLNVVMWDGDRLKLTSQVGRKLGRVTEEEFSRVLLGEIGRIRSYRGVLEWAHHNGMIELPVSEVSAHWYDHFRQDLGTEKESEISHKAVCFLQLCSGAGLGKLLAGRRGQPTRLIIARDVLEAFAKAEPVPVDRTQGEGAPEEIPLGEGPEEAAIGTKRPPVMELGKAIFIGHGKNKKPLEQLKKILDQFKIPYKVAVEEPNRGRPIVEKIRETMQACNCAILIFTADEEFTDKEGKEIYRPNENVIHELGAAGYLYDNRIVIMKEDKVDLPSNFKDIGYIQFSKDQIEAKTMEIIKELIAFGIIQFKT